MATWEDEALTAPAHHGRRSPGFMRHVLPPRHRSPSETAARPDPRHPGNRLRAMWQFGTALGVCGGRSMHFDRPFAGGRGQFATRRLTRMSSPCSTPAWRRRAHRDALFAWNLATSCGRARPAPCERVPEAERRPATAASRSIQSLASDLDPEDLLLLRLDVLFGEGPHAARGSTLAPCFLFTLSLSGVVCGFFWTA
jgi:hypothetical protein